MAIMEHIINFIDVRPPASGPHFAAVVLDRLAPQPAPLSAWLAAARA